MPGPEAPETQHPELGPAPQGFPGQWGAMEGCRVSWALGGSEEPDLGPTPVFCLPPHLRKVPRDPCPQVAASHCPPGRRVVPLPPHSQGVTGMRSAETELGGTKAQAPGAPDSILAEPRLGVPNNIAPSKLVGNRWLIAWYRRGNSA